MRVHAVHPTTLPARRASALRARGAPAILVRMNAKPLAVGIDASTQGVKALALGPDGPEALAAVNFAKDLPRFGAPEGFSLIFSSI